MSENSDSEGVRTNLFSSKICRICKTEKDGKLYTVLSLESDLQSLYSFDMANDIDCMAKHVCKGCYKRIKKGSAASRQLSASKRKQSLQTILSQNLLPLSLPSLLEINVGTNTRRKSQKCSVCGLPGHKKNSKDCSGSSSEVRSPVKKKPRTAKQPLGSVKKTRRYVRLKEFTTKVDDFARINQEDSIDLLLHETKRRLRIDGHYQSAMLIQNVIDGNHHHAKLSPEQFLALTISVGLSDRQASQLRSYVVQHGIEIFPQVTATNEIKSKFHPAMNSHWLEKDGEIIFNWEKPQTNTENGKEQMKPFFYSDFVQPVPGVPQMQAEGITVECYEGWRAQNCLQWITN